VPENFWECGIKAKGTSERLVSLSGCAASCLAIEFCAPPRSPPRGSCWTLEWNFQSRPKCCRSWCFCCWCCRGRLFAPRPPCPPSSSTWPTRPKVTKSPSPPQAPGTPWPAQSPPRGSSQVSQPFLHTREKIFTAGYQKNKSLKFFLHKINRFARSPFFQGCFRVALIRFKIVFGFCRFTEMTRLDF